MPSIRHYLGLAATQAAAENLVSLYMNPSADGVRGEAAPEPHRASHQSKNEAGDVPRAAARAAMFLSEGLRSPRSIPPT